MGARKLILAGFGSLGLGYAGAAVTAWGLAGFLVTTSVVGLGVGIVVGGALRSIAIDEAPAAVRGSAQGLINICSSIGTLLSATTIGAIADFGGGGTAGFATAYTAVAVAMALMWCGSFALRNDGGALRAAAVVR
jgi:MFS family permease